MKTSKSALLLLAAISLLFSCEKADPAKSDIASSSNSTITKLTTLVCDVKNPVEDLLWLKQKKELILKDKVDWGFEVYAVPYKGETVLWGFSPIYNSYPLLYHCNGEGIDFPLNPYSDPDALALERMIASPAVCAYKVYSSPGASKRCQ